MKGKTVKERSEYQLNEWLKGNSIHNQVDNQCVPDFSCCRKELQADEETRLRYVKSSSAEQYQMLSFFLQKSINLVLKEKGSRGRIYIAGDQTNQQKGS